MATSNVAEAYENRRSEHPKVEPMVWPRPDDDDYSIPNREVDDAVLGAWSTQDRPDLRSLGDLVVDMICGTEVLADSNYHPQAWQTLENAFLKNIAVELRVFNAARNFVGHDEGIDIASVSENDCTLYLENLQKRVTAGAELCQRLRSARWGHPSFGGGEKLAEKEAAELADLTAAAKQQPRAEDTPPASSKRRKKASKQKAVATQ